MLIRTLRPNLEVRLSLLSLRARKLWYTVIFVFTWCICRRNRTKETNWLQGSKWIRLSYMDFPRRNLSNMTCHHNCWIQQTSIEWKDFRILGSELSLKMLVLITFVPVEWRSTTQAYLPKDSKTWPFQTFAPHAWTPCLLKSKTGPFSTRSLSRGSFSILIITSLAANICLEKLRDLKNCRIVGPPSSYHSMKINSTTSSSFLKMPQRVITFRLYQDRHLMIRFLTSIIRLKIWGCLLLLDKVRNNLKTVYHSAEIYLNR